MVACIFAVFCNIGIDYCPGEVPGLDDPVTSKYDISVSLAHKPEWDIEYKGSPSKFEAENFLILENKC